MIPANFTTGLPAPETSSTDKFLISKDGLFSITPALAYLDAYIATLANFQIAGGTTGQILLKNTLTAGDYSFQNVVGAIIDDASTGLTAKTWSASKIDTAITTGVNAGLDGVPLVAGTSNGQTLAWNTGTSKYEPSTPLNLSALETGWSTITGNIIYAGDGTTTPPVGVVERMIWTRKGKEVRVAVDILGTLAGINNITTTIPLTALGVPLADATSVPTSTSAVLAGLGIISYGTGVFYNTGVASGLLPTANLIIALAKTGASTQSLVITNTATTTASKALFSCRVGITFHTA